MSEVNVKEQAVKRIFAQWGIIQSGEITETVNAITGSFSETQKEAAKTDEWGTILKALPAYAKIIGKEIDDSLLSDDSDGEDKLPDTDKKKDKVKSETYVPPAMNSDVKEDIKAKYIASNNLQKITNSSSVEGYIYEKQAAKKDAKDYPKKVPIKDYAEEQWEKWRSRIPQDAEGKNLAAFEEIKKKAQSGEEFDVFFSDSPATIKGAVIKTIDTTNKDEVVTIRRDLKKLKGFLIGKTLGFVPSNGKYFNAALQLAQPTKKTGKSVSKGRTTLEFRVKTLGNKKDAYLSDKSEFLSEIKYKKDGTPETEESSAIPTVVTFEVKRYRDGKEVPNKTTTVRLKGKGNVPVYVRKSGKGFEWVKDFKSLSKSGYIGKVNGVADLEEATNSYLGFVSAATSGEVEDLSSLGSDVSGLMAVVNASKAEANKQVAEEFNEQ